jgi:hypothetical protein
MVLSPTTGRRTRAPNGASPPARRPRTRETAPVPAAVPAMGNDQLTTVVQQLIAQVASDHAWFGSVVDDMNDHADRLEKTRPLNDH